MAENSNEYQPMGSIPDRDAPWDARARELEATEGPYCVYAAWKEWFTREVDDKLPDHIPPILDTLGTLGDIHLFLVMERLATGRFPVSPAPSVVQTR